MGLAVGVRLETLWYAVYGFRFDASEVLAAGSRDAPDVRAWLLAARSSCVTGMLLIVGGFLVHLPHAWDDDAPLTAGTLLVLLVDVAGRGARRQLLAGLPVPAGARPWCSAPALLAGAPARRGRAMRVSVMLAAVSCVLLDGRLGASTTPPARGVDEIDTGQAIRDVAEPGDTLVVYGGRADIVMATGLESPYEHLWSLPMRTLDPELAELSALLAADKRPTWVVEWVVVRRLGRRRQRRLRRPCSRSTTSAHGDGCGHHIWLLKDVDRAVPEPDCDEPWL